MRISEAVKREIGQLSVGEILRAREQEKFHVPIGGGGGGEDTDDAPPEPLQNLSQAVLGRHRSMILEDGKECLKRAHLQNSGGEVPTEALEHIDVDSAIQEFVIQGSVEEGFIVFIVGLPGVTSLGGYEVDPPVAPIVFRYRRVEELYEIRYDGCPLT